jgi:hypothetical protein
MKLREKAIIALEGLFIGQVIKFGIGSVGLSEHNELYIEGYIERNNKKQYIQLPVPDISLERFIKMCNNLTDDEVFIIASQTALTKVNRRKHET